VNQPPAYWTHDAAALMIDAWSARFLCHIEDVALTRADRLETARGWVRHAMALPMAGAGAAVPLLPSPKGR
jgi:hypothetical protein